MRRYDLPYNDQGDWIGPVDHNFKPDYSVCPVCHGFGDDEDTGVPCTPCNGTGDNRVYLTD